MNNRYNSNSTLSHETSNTNNIVNNTNTNNNSVQASSTHHHNCGVASSGGSSSTSSSSVGGGHQNFPGVSSSPQDDRLSIASSNDREDLRQATTAICVRKLSHRLTG